MIFKDDSTIKISGVILPGLIKNFEIKNDAKVEEQEVEGSAAKPKQATGFEDAKITIDLILDDSEKKSKEDKLKVLQSLFRKSGQGRPNVYEIVNQHTALRGIRKVIFKSLSSKETNKKNELEINIELWEYVVSTITAKKKGKKTDSKAAGGRENLKKEYVDYLNKDRGKAPVLRNKTGKSPAQDTANTSAARDRQAKMKYK